MRRKRGWAKEREEEGERENLRLDGFSPALFLTFATAAFRQRQLSGHSITNPIAKGLCYNEPVDEARRGLLRVKITSHRANGTMLSFLRKLLAPDSGSQTKRVDS